MEVVFPRTRGIRRKVQFKSIYLNHPPQGNSTDSSTNYSPLSSSSFLSGGRLWHHFHSVGQGSDYSPAIWPGRLSQTSLSLAENSGCLTWVRHSSCQSSSTHSYQCSVAAFSCVQTVVRLPLFGICNVRSDVDACDYTRELYGHHQRVCTESWLWEKNKKQPCRTGDSNPRQYCVWLFCRTLYQVSYPRHYMVVAVWSDSRPTH